MKVSRWLTSHQHKTQVATQTSCRITQALIIFIFISNTYASTRTTEPSKEQGASYGGTLTQWHAFGSGCRASSEKPGQFMVKSKQIATGVVVQFEPHEFGLALKKGLKGVRECALRLTLEPPENHKIKLVRARTELEATKSDGDRLRSRILLLLGDSLIARREWDLQKSEFAKHRNEEMIIVPDTRALELFKASRCGQTHIIGLDFTFEGVRSEAAPLAGTAEQSHTRSQSRDELTTLQLRPNIPAEVEVLFEKCSQ